MSRDYLTYIDDQQLEKSVAKVISKVQAKMEAVEVDLHKNVVDPFSAAFDAAIQGIILDEWLNNEKSRQAQKTLQNAMGMFYQEVLGAVDGWNDTGRGGSYDVGHEEGKIIAEIKSKHNTMNSGGQQQVYQNLANHLQYDKKGYTAYLVEILPKHAKPYDEPWSPNSVRFSKREDIRKIDGRSFFALATGSPGALRDLYTVLPRVFEKVLGDQAGIIEKSNLFTDLFDIVYGK